MSDERQRLERAAYRRDATDTDRAALAAFNVGRLAVAEQRIGGVEAVRDASRGEMGHQGRWAMKRLVSLALLSGVALGALGAGTAAVLAAQPWSADPFARFTDAAAIDSELARLVAGSYQLDSDPGGTVVAGPVMLQATGDVRVAAFIDARYSGQQNVCLLVAQQVGGASSIDWACTPRDDFMNEGVTIGMHPPMVIGSDPSEDSRVRSVTWGADDTLSMKRG